MTDKRTGRQFWDIRTNALAIGVNVHIVIDDTTGEVVERGYLPR
ncbi:MAG: hypothetical protein ACREMV_01640 [Gemmatimonadales bacterium]